MPTAADGYRRPRAPWWAFAGPAALVFVLLFARSMTRDLDPDEHQFVTPPLLLARAGLRPYADYPYFHMPTLVYLYAGLIGGAPYALLAARLVSVLCGTATVCLLFAAVWRVLKRVGPAERWWLAGGLTLVFLGCRKFAYTSGLAWNHDTAVLAALAAALLHLRGLRRASLWPFAAAGFLLGVAVGIRLSFALAFVPFGLSLLFGRSALTVRQRLAGLTLAAAAGALALVPALVPLVTDTDRFLFGNLGYPRLNTLYYAATSHYPLSLPGRLGISLVHFVADPGNAILLAACLLAVGYPAWRARVWSSASRTPLALLLGLIVALGVGAVGPSPVHYQYHYMLVPFLVLAAAYGIAGLSADAVALRRWTRGVAVAAVVMAVVGLPRWYWGVVNLSAPGRWTPVALHHRGEWLREQVGPGARVLTVEPAVPLEAGLAVYPEYAVGRFVVLVAPFQSAAERERYGMMGGDELDAWLADRPPDAIYCDSAIVVPEFVRYATDHGYRPVAALDPHVVLWVRPRAEALASATK